MWLYYRFSLSYRDVEELMAERGVTMSHEAVRYWCRKFGQTYANRLRRRRPRPGDKWHLMEMHGIPKDEVIAWLPRHGAKIIQVMDDTSAGPNWVSFRYVVTKP